MKPCSVWELLKNLTKNILQKPPKPPSKPEQPIIVFYVNETYSEDDISMYLLPDREDDIIHFDILEEYLQPVTSTRDPPLPIKGPTKGLRKATLNLTRKKKPPKHKNPSNKLRLEDISSPLKDTLKVKPKIKPKPLFKPLPPPNIPLPEIPKQCKICGKNLTYVTQIVQPEEKLYEYDGWPDDEWDEEIYVNE